MCELVRRSATRSAALPRVSNVLKDTGSQLGSPSTPVIDQLPITATWRPTVEDFEEPGFASRFTFGVFGEWAPDQDKGFRAGHVGVQSDMNLLATPLYGRLSPVLSLGAG
ncbi:MAG: hypothetical protein K0S86_1475, partial [Geminicoccaceae bacterium]|nr:hypothetical protein [Geminicoccaceae bacterium]